MRAVLLVTLLLAPAALATESSKAGSEGDAPSVEEAGEAVAPADEEAQAEPPALPRPRIGLDRLLDPRAAPALPPQDAAGEGRSRRLWREDFQEIEREIDTLEGRIDGAQQRFREVAGHEWGYTPPGAGAPTDPEVLRIRAQLKRDRQSLETARRRKRDLEIEASLAGVPRSWLERDPE